MDIVVTVPDEYWPRVATAFHVCYPNNADTPDVDLVQMAATSYIKNTWVSTEQSQNQTAAQSRYSQAAQDYTASRQQIDADVQAENSQVQSDGDTAFPGV
ncbi:hypothetical protein [Streptomyces sp. NPDC059468]|uniref:hypothetical protein n=1 Tax=Streptomyces sp. NPDC059468 TaxID=3346845 RepID=UPI00368105F9